MNLVREKPTPFRLSLEENAAARMLFDRFAIRSVLADGWKLLWGRLPAVLGVSALFAIPGGLVSFASWNFFVEFLPSLTGLPPLMYSATVGLLCPLVCLALMKSHVEGRRISFLEAFETGSRRWVDVFFAEFVAGVQIAVFTLLLVIPGVVKCVRAALVLPVAFIEVGEGPQPVWRSLDRSRQLLSGYGWKMAGVFCVLAIISIVASWLSMPIVQYIHDLLGAKVRQPISWMLVDFVSEVRTAFFAATMLAAYYSLCSTSRSVPV